MKTATITLNATEMEVLANLLAEFAGDLEDDGRDGNPDAALIWKLQRVIREAA